MTPSTIRAVIGLVVTMLFLFAGTWLYLQGRTDGWNKRDVQAQSEKKAQTEANNEAVRVAGENYRKRLEAQRQEIKRLQDEIPALDDEADADPDADTGGLSADSVRRIDAIH